MTPVLRPFMTFIAGSVLATGLFAQAPAAALEFPDPSPAATLKQRVGITDIEINYSRPGMKGRDIFGRLVPNNQVWRTGANSATKLTVSTPVKLNGTEIPAGTYELFSIPSVRGDWTVIIHKNMSQWGAYTYDEKNDVARLSVTPIPLAQPVETFTFEFSDLRDESATLSLLWELVRIPLEIKVEVVGTLVPRIEAAMATPDPKLPYLKAAMFYYDHDLDLKKALDWINAAIAAEPGAFHITYRKALIQEKMGDKAGAKATAQASLEAANKADGSLKSEYVRLNQAVLSRL